MNWGNREEFVCPIFLATVDAITQNICMLETKWLIYTLYSINLPIITLWNSL
jgi:hypothetical protein